MRDLGIITIVAMQLAMGTAWAAKAPVAKMKVGREAKKVSKRMPASQPKFACEEPEVQSGSSAVVVAKFLNDRCDSTKSYTVTMTNPGSYYPITICCILK